MDTKDLIEQQRQIIELQVAEIKFLKERIAELERRLNLNSNNSSKPPSSDGFKKKNKKDRSLRDKGKNKTGGQKGHTGSTLKQTNEPDKTIVHELDFCPDCGENLKTVPVHSISKRQVFDLVIPKIKVTEHQVETKCCDKCCKAVSSNFPDGINAPVQYGPVIKSLSIYLQNQHFIPEKRLQTIFKDIFDIRITSSTFKNFNIKITEQLTDIIQSIDDGIYNDNVKHLDETGFRVDGKLQWLHVASTDKLTSYRIDKRRGEIPKAMLGVIVHDHWQPYFSVAKAKHAMCNAHILRELTGVFEQDNEAWAKKMFRLLRLACKVKNEYPDDVPKRWQGFIARTYDNLVKDGLILHDNLPPLAQKKAYRPKRRTGHNLLLRLQDYSYETLRFLYDPDVPFTNNQAEQDLRMMKVKQKISGCFRASSGAEIFCAIRSYLSTARKQGWNILQSVVAALNGNIPALALT